MRSVDGLFLGTGTGVLRERFPDASVDMIYADPPFGNEQMWTGKAGTFSDKWSWTDASEADWQDLHRLNPAGAKLLEVIAGRESTLAYLAMMAGLLIQCRRVLKPTGTLWLHHDDTMSAELRILGDAVFGLEHQLGTVIWHRSTGRATRRGFARVHDTVACFARTRAAMWRLARCRGEFAMGDPCFGVFVDGFADDRLVATSKERVGYPTQKPVRLVERFIRGATLPGDLVVDPTCGSGTTLVAAGGLGRRWAGIDLSTDAIAAASARLGLPLASLEAAA